MSTRDKNSHLRHYVVASLPILVGKFLGGNKTRTCLAVTACELCFAGNDSEDQPCSSVTDVNTSTDEGLCKGNYDTILYVRLQADNFDKVASLV